AAVGDRELGGALHVEAAAVGGEGGGGRFSTAPPDSMPRMREHHPYVLNERLMFTAIAYAAFDQVYLLWSAPAVSSSKSNSSTGLVFAPYGSRERKRGMHIAR